MPGPYKPLTPDQLVGAKTFAPFELAEIFAEWSRRGSAEATANSWGSMDMRDPVRLQMLDGLGPPWPIILESHEDYGLRIATAIVHLIKEI